ncbi:hypothetical protein ACE6H2_002182 [Prunus campanulata]
MGSMVISFATNPCDLLLAAIPCDLLLAAIPCGLLLAAKVSYSWGEAHGLKEVTSSSAGSCNPEKGAT